MKTIIEQKVFNFSSVFLAACLVVPATISQFLDDNLIDGFLFGTCSIAFLFFIYWLNLKLQKLNGLLSAFIITYASYTFLVSVFTIAYIPFDLPLNFNSHFRIAAISLVYGYVLNIGISIIVYILYKVIMLYKNYSFSNTIQKTTKQ